MRSYLCSFLLLFLLLLVDKSLSARVHSSLNKAIYKQIWPSSTVVTGSTWDKNMHNIEEEEEKLSPPQPPLKQIKGLSRIKEYFSNFGYLQSFGPFNDSLDQETKIAIKTHQQYFNLQPTGDLNNETFQQISLPHCSVPDMNFSYDIGHDNVSWPKVGNRWFPKRNLTYGFLPASQIPPNATKARLHTAVAVLNMPETSYDDADIEIGLYNLDEGVEDIVWGGSIIRLHPAIGVLTGEIRLDGTTYWASGNDSILKKEGILDLESAAMHQIGHLLGLDHSNKEDSVMYPYVLPSQPRKVQLSDSDKTNFQRQYTNSAHGRSWGVLLVTTFALGFAYLFLLFL